MDVNGQFHAPVTFTPEETAPGTVGQAGLIAKPVGTRESNSGHAARSLVTIPSELYILDVSTVIRRAGTAQSV
jgi:hypothetical protein